MNDLQSVRDIISNSKAILVYFKNDACAPCLALRPKVAELIENAFPEMKMLVVDTVQSPELAGAFNVFSNPSLLVFFEGREYLRKSKYISIPELESEIKRLYDMVFE